MTDEKEYCPICQNTVTMVVENGDETVYKHGNRGQGSCVEHDDGRVSVTWDKWTLINILRDAEIGTHYQRAAERGLVDEIIDTDALEDAWDGEKTGAMPMTKYQQNGYDARMSENLERGEE